MSDPKPLIMVKYYIHRIGEEDYDYICPHCGEIVVNPRRTYCNNCLQPIDISKVEVFSRVKKGDKYGLH